MSDLYIGLMSGTSVDGIDAVLVDFAQNPPVLLATHYQPFEKSQRSKILALCKPGPAEIQRLGELDVLLGQAFAEAANTLIRQNKKEIRGLGSHGQTIRHMPGHTIPFTLQIGDPNVIAARTGMITVADFRRKDMALGGQGAPLVPAFHHYLFATADTIRAIVNIGGIANMTLAGAGVPIRGFDTGPGNTLLDSWIFQQLGKIHDSNGGWGRQGHVNAALLQRLLDDGYFRLQPPKSTGPEYFNLVWLSHHLKKTDISTVDVQATLTELTALTIVNAIKDCEDVGEILVCGGGAHNGFLMSRLQALAPCEVASTEKYGLHPDWIEAMAFAWLARQTLLHKTGNLPAVTGSSRAAVLGGIYYP